MSWFWLKKVDPVPKPNQNKTEPTKKQKNAKGKNQDQLLYRKGKKYR